MKPHKWAKELKAWWDDDSDEGCIMSLLQKMIDEGKKMSKQHRWHKEIKAWADGAEIEKWMLNDTWQRVGHPDWYEFENYRIKPTPKEPQYLYVYRCTGDGELRLHEDKDLEGSRWKLKGKIKLEVDDE